MLLDCYLCEPHYTECLTKVLLASLGQLEIDETVTMMDDNFLLESLQ